MKGRDIITTRDLMFAANKRQNIHHHRAHISDWRNMQVDKEESSSVVSEERVGVVEGA